MAQFNVTGSGLIDLTLTDLSPFAGLTFATTGDTTALVTASQLAKNGLGTALTFVGSGFRDTVDIQLSAGEVFSAANFSFVTWSSADRLVFRDSTGNENMIGSSRTDHFVVSSGIDNVDGGAGTDTLFVNYAAKTGSFNMSGNSFSDFSSTAVAFSGIEQFNLQLGSGNDNVVTGSGADTLNGGQGNDTLNSGAGRAVIDGGLGTDLWAADFSADFVAKTIDLTLSGLQNADATTTYRRIERLSVTGSSGNDFLGTRTDNANDGLHDLLNGGAGNDTLVVGGGIDTVDGGADDDLLIVDWSSEGAGNSFSMAGGGITDFSNTSVAFSNIERFDIRLGAGNDSVSTGAGDDSLSGGLGNDTLNSGAGAAVIEGGLGNDLWMADFSADGTAKTIDIRLAGLRSAGNGTTYQGLERLSILGGAGNDFLATRTDNANDGLADSLNGGDGNDTLVVGGGIDTVDGGLGNDLLIVDWSSEGASNSFSTFGAGITDFSNTSVAFSNIERFNIRLGAGSDNIATGSGSDSLYGGDGNDTLNSGSGGGFVDGGNGTDLWIANFLPNNGAKSIDLMLGGTQVAGGGMSYAGIERMNITTGNGNDYLATRTDNANDGLADNLVAGGGNDTIVVGGGIDIVDGGDGDDLLIVDWSSEGAGNSFSMVGAGVFSDFSNTQVTFSKIERFDVRLGAGSDNIVLLAGDDTLSGGNGNDTLNAAEGKVTIDGGEGTDLWLSNLSAETVNLSINLMLSGTQAAGGGNSYSGIERMFVTAGSGNDLLASRTDNANDGLSDTLVGAQGNDTLIVGGGIDVVDGGLDDDLLIIDYSTEVGGSFSMAGPNTISDFSNTQVTFSNIEAFDIRLGTGNDNITLGSGDDSFSGGAGNDTANGGLGTDTLVFTKAGAAITLAYVGGGNGTAAGDGFDTFTSFENAILGDFNDVVTGDSTANRFQGGNGADRLNGGGGNDTLLGDAGADRLNGGGGIDLMTGGSGVDRFIFGTNQSSAVAANADRITDFVSGTDQILLSSIDAIAGGLDDAFTWIGGAAFGALGEARVTTAGGNTFIELNYQGGLAADMVIRLDGIVVLNPGDVVL